MSQPYILRRDGRDYQAPDLESMRQWARDGRVLPADMVYSPKYQSWYRARDLRELRDVLPQNEPPPVAVGPAVAPPQQFWLRKGDRNYVASDLQTILTWAEQGNINPDDFIYHPAYEKWFRAGDSPQLVSRFPAGLRPGHDPFVPVEDDPMASKEARRSTAPLASGGASGGAASEGLIAATDSTEPVSGAAAEAARDGAGAAVDPRDVERADSLAKTVMDFRAADLHRMLRDKERAARTSADGDGARDAAGGESASEAEARLGSGPLAGAGNALALKGRDPGWGRPDQGLFARPLGPEPTGEGAEDADGDAAAPDAGDGATPSGPSGAPAAGSASAANGGPATSAERPATPSDRSSVDEVAASGERAAERAAAERAAAERAAAERAAAERAATERAAAERAAAERAAAERSVAERAVAERSAAERSAAERAAAERSAAERSAAERSAAERSAGEGSDAADAPAPERTAATSPRPVALGGGAPRVPLPERPGAAAERPVEAAARAPVRPPPPPPEALGSEPTAAMQEDVPAAAPDPVDEDARFVDRTGVMKLFYDVARAYVVTKDLRPGELLETACKLPTTNDSFLGQGKKTIYMTLRKRIDEHIAGPLAAVATDLEQSNRPGYALLMHRANELAAVLAEGERVIGQKGPDRVVVGNQGRPKMSPEEADIMLRLDAALKGLISVRDRSQAA